MSENAARWILVLAALGSLYYAWRTDRRLARVEYGTGSMPGANLPDGAALGLAPIPPPVDLGAPVFQPSKAALFLRRV
jgi:hypothetical protein